MAAIFVASSQARVRAPGPDWGLHAAAYCVLGLLLARALWPAGPRGLGLGLVTALCLAYGLGDEWHQSFVPGRTAEGGDVVADTLGGGLGALLYAWWRR
jgi:VanZ family protein